MGTSFKNRIIVLCVGLVLITAIASLAGFWWSTSQFKERQVQQDIQKAQSVYQQYLVARERLLVTAASVLTQDFGFKQAVATRDASTISSVLYNHSQRINAELMLLLDMRGKLISTNQNQLVLPQDMRPLVKELLAHEERSAFLVLDKKLYQAIILPVKAPRTIAFTIVGFVVDEPIAEQLKGLTGMEMSFISLGEKMKASSIQLPEDRDLFAYLHEQKISRWFGEYPLYINAEVALPSLSQVPVSLILSADLRSEYEEFDQLVLTIVFLSCITMLFGFLASGFLAKNLATPLQQLTVMARRFAKGDYNAEIHESRPTEEICQLVDAFHEMGDDIQAREKQIRYQASHDSLTGFYNRTSALPILDALVSTDQVYYLLALDIKGLRHINDKLGPRIGDSCIEAVAKRIEIVTSSFEGLNIRLGGDEFLTVLQAKPDSTMENCVDSFLSELSKSYTIHSFEISLRFSVGVVHSPEQADNADDSIRRALIAADNAAHGVEDVYFYQTGEDEAYLERLEIIDELKQALVDDDGQLFMTYQPKLNMRSGMVDKVESLIRWKRKSGDWVSPELFIDLAEQSGLIVDLTQWVLKTVVSQIAHWEAQGVTMKAAINVSAQDIADVDFIPHLQSVLSEFSVAPGLITIELTERDMIENEEKGIAALLALKELGVHISLDDYGVGQTSLGRLKMLPIDELKLDKVFILKLAASHQDQCIVRSTISLGHQLGFSVVAEGVEDADSLQLLDEMKCDYAQGYYLSRPLKANDLTQWLGQYHKAG
ncbi:diguanylate phosphodiesterase [Pseudoalteromonas luteoviolacea S2607]|uniref:bifunctional diguanylate cyclase/phosphodiesterase n=1 Tax=Pseudoalteromonas luteoviolacea TaxID=43657 RepID=UPI0007B08CAF|nr:EAL domain-containing protein [Pseudoalteromonas luteoviolacea]KZN32634.1 diguanylate phosphodiesterase [Pseudoalteromonas luteoviolacea S2607]